MYWLSITVYVQSPQLGWYNIFKFERTIKWITDFIGRIFLKDMEFTWEKSVSHEAQCLMRHCLIDETAGHFNSGRRKSLELSPQSVRVQYALRSSSKFNPCSGDTLCSILSLESNSITGSACVYIIKPGSVIYFGRDIFAAGGIVWFWRLNHSSSRSSRTYWRWYKRLYS